MHSFYEIPSKDGMVYKQHLYRMDRNQRAIKDESLFCNYSFYMSASSITPGLRTPIGQIEAERIPPERTCVHWEGIEKT